jgi:hypothetical protein
VGVSLKDNAASLSLSLALSVAVIFFSKAAKQQGHHLSLQVRMMPFSQLLFGGEGHIDADDIRNLFFF